MDMNDVARTSLLYDFYGGLLTERQREAMRLYHEENLSLSERADAFSVSRQAGHDAIKNAERSLAGYEEKLGLVERSGRSMRAIAQIDGMIDDITAKIDGSVPENSRLISELGKIKSIIDKLEE